MATPKAAAWGSHPCIVLRLSGRFAEQTKRRRPPVSSGPGASEVVLLLLVMVLPLASQCGVDCPSGSRVRLSPNSG